MYSGLRAINKVMKILDIQQNIRLSVLKNFVTNVQLPTNSKAFAYLKSKASFPIGTSISKRKCAVGRYKYDLSIIVPAYNAEKFISSCLESLFNQITSYTIQIIVIDDGSTDGTYEIVKNFKKKYSTILKVIVQNNKGFSGARNTGLDHINSKYIAFVDSDDLVPHNFVNELLNTAYKHSADIVEGSYQKFNKNKHLQKAYLHKKELNVDPYKKLYGYPWGKVYKAELFNNVKFPEGFWYEDTVGMYRVWPKAKKVVTISPIVYYYRINHNGITFSSRKKMKSLDSLYVTMQLLSDCKKAHEKLNYSLYNFTLYQMAMNFYRIRLLDKRIIINSFVVMARILEKYFPNESFITNDKKLKMIERGLRTNNYRLFISSCLAM